MKRYAFIDVQNTESTCLKILGIIIDWQKTINYLEDRWSCEKIFLYPGIEIGDEERREMFTDLKGSTAEVLVISKEYKKYKNQDKVIATHCPECQSPVISKISMGYSWKCNCDVELTTDVFLHLADQDLSEIFLFSGDGDFVCLIEEIIKREIAVKVFSSALPILGTKDKKRLATKLKQLTDETGKPVTLLEMNNLKLKLQKNIDETEDINL